jgi:dihydroorotase
MGKYLIRNAKIINEGKIIHGNVLIEGKKIARISQDEIYVGNDIETLDTKGLWLLPGIIDDQVHFREPGLTHKGDIYSESRAAAAGGVTSYMEMPNTVPQALSIEELEKKYAIAAGRSLTNYSFYMGASNDNIEEVRKVDPSRVCGLKIFMGASTGNMLVDDKKTLEALFAESPVLIATHCEDEETIRQNSEKFRKKYGENILISAHPAIRSAEACYLSSSLAVSLAEKYNTRLHILHISTAKELGLFRNDIPSAEKRITAEVCIHHLWFNDADYAKKGTLIKWNPAVKTEEDRRGLFEGLLDDRLDLIATDHAPHTLSEKSNSYFKAPSGGPMVQHSLVAMIEFVKQEKISIEKVVDKMCHKPAELFQIEKRGFIREGYYADLVLVNPNDCWEVNSSNIMYKCGWSPMEGQVFNSSIRKTFVNGEIVYDEGKIIENEAAMRLRFER